MKRAKQRTRAFLPWLQVVRSIRRHGALLFGQSNMWGTRFWRARF